MLSGFNTNYRHRGAVFHVQTENTTARGTSHLITHLYFGGTILASEKSPGETRDADELRAQMERQHVAMLRALRDGDFDDLIAERLGTAVLGESEKADTQPAAASAGGVGNGGARAASGRRLDVLVADYLAARGRGAPAGSPRTAK